MGTMHTASYLIVSVKHTEGGKYNELIDIDI